MTYFKTTIVEIGAMAAEFESEKMLILFGSEAPAGLKDFCYNIQAKPLEQEIKAGDQIVFDRNEYEITAIGTTANETFRQLYHMTIKFDGKNTPDLPGTMHVAGENFPKLSLGTTIALKEK